MTFNQRVPLVGSSPFSDPCLAEQVGTFGSEPVPAAIPAIVHQTWRSADLPPQFARWQAGWRDLHPTWEHRFYDDVDLRRVVADRAPRWLRILDAMPRHIQRIDLFRYLIVYLDGGLYADIDMVPYQPSNPLLKGADCVLAVEHHVRASRQAALGYRMPYQLANCIFAAVPGHPFFGELIENIARQATAFVRKDDDVEELTGPRMLTRLAYALPAERRGRMRVVAQITWMPPWHYPRTGPLTSRIYARHAAVGLWRTERRWRTHLRHLLAWNRWPDPFAATGPELP